MSANSQKPSPNDKAPEQSAKETIPIQQRREQFQALIEQKAETLAKTRREHSANLWGSTARRPTNH